MQTVLTLLVGSLLYTAQSHLSNHYPIILHCTFLDASKAFDKVSLNGLYLTLIERGAPLSLIRILITMYTGLQCAVVWNGTIGYSSDVKCGVRQGGVLSPYLFSVYVDDLIKELTVRPWYILLMGCIL